MEKVWRNTLGVRRPREVAVEQAEWTFQLPEPRNEDEKMDLLVQVLSKFQLHERPDAVRRALVHLDPRSWPPLYNGLGAQSTPAPTVNPQELGHGSAPVTATSPQAGTNLSPLSSDTYKHPNHSNRTAYEGNLSSLDATRISNSPVLPHQTTCRESEADTEDTDSVSSNDDDVVYIFPEDSSSDEEWDEIDSANTPEIEPVCPLQDDEEFDGGIRVNGKKRVWDAVPNIEVQRVIEVFRQSEVEIPISAEEVWKLAANPASVLKKTFGKFANLA